VFVAVSINIGHILRIRGLPGRPGESVILFVSALFNCACVLVPDQPVRALGVELLTAGVVTWAVLTGIVVRVLRRPTPQPRSWHVTRLLSVQAATIPTILSGLSLLGLVGGGLYWLVAAVLVSVFVATTRTFLGGESGSNLRERRLRDEPSTGRASWRVVRGR
jgi:hypothetical protein